MKLPKVNTEYALCNKNLYRVHCLTFGIAKELCGIPMDANLAMKVDFEVRSHELNVNDESGLATFRAFPRYRTPEAKKLRSKVCCRLIEITKLDK